MVGISFLDDCLFVGTVIHKRYEPFIHHLQYKATYFWIDIEKKKKNFFLKFNRFSFFSFMEKDFGDLARNKKKNLSDYYKERLTNIGILNISSLKVLCLPRILGYSFNPISIFVCYDFQKVAKAVIFEVSNTFGERHSYITKLNKNKICATKFKKKLHVSPFFDLAGTYKIKFHIDDRTTELEITYKKKNKKILLAKFTGKKNKLTNINLLKLFVFNSFQNIKVVLGIHIEAFLLWKKGATYKKKPNPPKRFISKSK